MYVTPSRELVDFIQYSTSKTHHFSGVIQKLQ